MGDRQDSAGSDVDYRWRSKIIGVAARLARLEWLDDYGVDLHSDPRAEQMRLASIALREGVDSVCLELDQQDAVIAELRAGLDAEGNPVAQDADPRLLAMANAHLVDRVRDLEARAVGRIAELTEASDALVRAERERDEARVALDAATRERDEALAQQMQARASDNHRAKEYAALRATYQAALDKIERLKAAPAAEREAIVAWLRADDSLSLASIEWITDAIERGEYTKEAGHCGCHCAACDDLNNGREMVRTVGCSCPVHFPRRST